VVTFNTIFGKIEIKSPYLWTQGASSKPLIDEMKITHQSRSEAVNRALVDFGIEDSFARAAERFKEHYHYDIGVSAAARSTKNTAEKAMTFLENKLSNSLPEQGQEKKSVDKMLVELDGCEIRTAQLIPIENSEETTPVYGNPKKNKTMGTKFSWIHRYQLVTIILMLYFLKLFQAVQEYKVRS